ncbi:MAG: GxxExxY protein [Patescibacteria group bacterium]
MQDRKYSDITGLIIKSAIDVHKFLGCGFLEEVYHKALFKELLFNKLTFVSKPEISVYYKDNTLLGIFYPDFIVGGKIIIEIKAAEGICDEYIAQTLNYLKAANLELAILINFGATSLQVKRLINKYFDPNVSSFENFSTDLAD